MCPVGEGGEDIPLTNKTGTAYLLVGTELDVRTIFTFTIQDIVARMTLNEWSTEAECARFWIFSV